VIAFEVLVGMHIATGSVGLLSFWVPVIGRKGGARHRTWGKVFVFALLATGTIAVGISTLSVLYPLETHPHMDDAVLVRGIFGWMMLYLAVLTVNLAWYGWLAVRHRTAYARNRRWHNLALQGLLAVATVNCLVQGILIGQVLMVGIAMVGVATVVTNVNHLMRADPPPLAWKVEHFKGLVGAGISVYTAFLAFGAVRLMPELALNPVLWAVPLITGLSIIFYHRYAVARQVRPRRAAQAEPAS
jgi:hypothetical protein